MGTDLLPSPAAPPQVSEVVDDEHQEECSVYETEYPVTRRAPERKNQGDSEAASEKDVKRSPQNRPSREKPLM